MTGPLGNRSSPIYQLEKGKKKKKLFVNIWYLWHLPTSIFLPSRWALSDAEVKLSAEACLTWSFSEMALLGDPDAMEPIRYNNRGIPIWISSPWLHRLRYTKKSWIRRPSKSVLSRNVWTRWLWAHGWVSNFSALSIPTQACTRGDVSNLKIKSEKAMSKQT